MTSKAPFSKSSITESLTGSFTESVVGGLFGGPTGSPIGVLTGIDGAISVPPSAAGIEEITESGINHQIGQTLNQISFNNSDAFSHIYGRK